MANENNTDRRSPIGLRRLVRWPLTEDTETAATYGTALEISKALMTATDTPSVQTAAQDADDQVVEDVTIVSGGTLAIGLTAINGEDRAAIYGNKLDGGTNVVNKDDIAPYGAVAYMTMRRDGKANLYKYPKIAFSPQAETFSTVKKEGINFAVTNLQGNYIPTISNGNAKFVRYGVDLAADAELVTKWFTDASYYTPESEQGV